MKFKTNILFSLLLCGTFATAQNLRLDILPPSVTLRQDSAVISMKMTFGVSQMDTKSHIRLTPILTDGEHSEELPQILLNGERAHRLYRRTSALNKRRGKTDVPPVFTAIALDEGNQSIDYRASLPMAEWVQQASLNIKKEVINGNGKKTQSENIPIPDKAIKNNKSNKNRKCFRSPTGQDPGGRFCSIPFCICHLGIPSCFFRQTALQGKLCISRKRCHR